jgi:succinate dehydrogenase iron-sulfur subunit
MDGIAVLACKVRMAELVDAGRVPVIAPMGNLPVIKDLVVDMNPFWEKYRSVMPYVEPAGAPEHGKEHLIPQQRMNAVHKESRCINCGCCVSECNAMESSPEFLGPQALAQVMRFVGDPRDGRKRERLEAVNGEHGIWECTRCYFCNERCPKGVDPRDAIAKLGAESLAEGIDGDLGARHAKWFVTSARTTGGLRETELVPKTQGVVDAVAQARFALELRRHGKVPRPFPPHVAKRVREAGLLYQVVREQGRNGYRGIVQGERGLARLAEGVHDGGRDPYGPGSFPRPFVAPDPEPEEGEPEAPA